ncbi:hypothetical protein Plo01_31330 [Planobispora longispora]|uniref:Uncharacterized protein n=1 Tax=Planobispora longispora TaxID=28887 RepID=A0A8J3RN86_9ACTN|nr:hypothetical protein Plo01_31330 [Planobispora longispora]
MDWNSLLSDDPDLLSTRYSDRYFPDADDMVRYLGDFAAACGLRVLYGTRVRHVARVPGEDLFQVTDERGRTREARRVIVATGVGRPDVPPIPGIETAEPYGAASTDAVGPGPSAAVWARGLPAGESLFLPRGSARCGPDGGTFRDLSWPTRRSCWRCVTRSLVNGLVLADHDGVGPGSRA